MPSPPPGTGSPPPGRTGHVLFPQGCSWHIATGLTSRCSRPGSTSWPAPSVSTRSGRPGCGPGTPSFLRGSRSWWEGGGAASAHCTVLSSHFSVIVAVFLFSCLLFDDFFSLSSGGPTLPSSLFPSLLPSFPPISFIIKANDTKVIFSHFLLAPDCFKNFLASPGGVLSS